MNKPNLIFLPGLLNDHRLFDQQITALADIASITVADLTQANSMSELAESVLTQAPAGPLAIAGLSMGGYLALEMMRRSPERISGLALLDTSARPDTAESTANRKTLMELAESDFEAVIEKLIPKLVHSSQLNDAHQIALIKSMAHALGKDVFIRQQQAIIGRSDSRPLLKAIHCPTLILCGAQDVITPVEVHEEMFNNITNSNLVILEDCGHLSTLGQPEQVTRSLKTWLNLLD